MIIVSPKYYASIDIEGNGYWGEKEEIVELSIVHFSEGKILKHGTWMFRSQNKINETATKIHGLTNDSVKDCPIFFEKKDEINLWIKDIPIVAHNSLTEVRLLKKNIVGWEPKEVYDTLKLSKKYLPNQVSYKLTQLISAFHLEDAIRNEMDKLQGKRGLAHTALFDAVASALLFEYLLKLNSKPDKNFKYPRQQDLFDF